MTTQNAATNVANTLKIASVTVTTRTATTKAVGKRSNKLRNTHVNSTASIRIHGIAFITLTEQKKAESDIIPNSTPNKPNKYCYFFRLLSENTNTFCAASKGFCFVRAPPLAISHHFTT